MEDMIARLAALPAPEGLTPACSGAAERALASPRLNPTRMSVVIASAARQWHHRRHEDCPMDGPFHFTARLAA